MLQLLRKWCLNTRIVFIIVRYISAAAIILETLIFAKLLGPQSFGTYALSIQVVGLLLLVGSGSAAGYIAKYYEKHEEIEDIEYNYIFGSLVQYICGGITLLICSLFSGSYFYISSLLLLIQIPYYISEPILRVRGNFALTAIGRASGAIGTLLLTTVMLMIYDRQITQNSYLDLQTGINIMLAGNITGYITYYTILFTRRYLSISLSKLYCSFSFKNLQKYWHHIIQPSWIYTLSSIIFTMFTYLDRFFLDRNYSKSNLSVYALAWQLAQSVLLLLTSLNTISGVRIGENHAGDSLYLIKVANRQLKISAIAGIFSLIVAIGASYLLNLIWYQDYNNLVVVTTIISLGYLSCGVIGSVTMLLFFERKYFQVTVAYISILLISFLGNIISHEYHLSFLYPVTISSCALVATNLWLWRLFKLTSNCLLANSVATVSR
jgi:O-antigen/teichoic acid export membrane protein